VLHRLARSPRLPFLPSEQNNHVGRALQNIATAPIVLSVVKKASKPCLASLSGRDLLQDKTAVVSFDDLDRREGTHNCDHERRLPSLLRAEEVMVA